MLYVAYGSNLNVQQMSYRCPGATVAFTGYLINWKLLYRGSRTGSYATVKRQKGSRVPVAVWNIDSKNEKALDLYEGYPRFYKKRNVFVQLKNGTRKKAMIYLLPDSATAGRPSSRYNLFGITCSTRSQPFPISSHKALLCSRMVPDGNSCTDISNSVDTFIIFICARLLSGI